MQLCSAYSSIASMRTLFYKIKILKNKLNSEINFNEHYVQILVAQGKMSLMARDRKIPTFAVQQ